MQIFPASNGVRNQTSVNANKQLKEESFSFSSYLEGADYSTGDLESQATEELSNELSSMTSNQPEATSTMQEAGPGELMESMADDKVTMEDFAALRPDLEEHGLSRDTLESIEDRIESEEGLTWGEFTHMVHEEMDNSGQTESVENLSDEQKNNLYSFFQKLGFSPSQAGQMIRDLQGGEQAKAWKVLSAKLAELPVDATITVTRGELAALGKLIGLNKESLDRVKGLLGGKGQATLNSRGLSKALTSIRREALTSLHKNAEEANDLRNALEKAMRKAHDRADLEKLADNRSTREEEMEEALIKDAAADRYGKESKKVLGESLEQDKAATGKKNQHKLVTPDAGEDKQVKAQTKDANKVLPTDAKARAAANTVQRAETNLSSDQKDTGSQDKDAKNWSEFWDKVDTSQAAKSAARAAEAVAAAEAATTGKADALNQMVNTGVKRAAPAQGILRAVQSGVLKNLGQGRHELTLRMDPPTLGKLSVTLAVKGNELTAVLKTESSEATQVLNDQLPQIKQHLEQQGLKVAKLDVQTQLEDQGTGRDWLGAEQHNMSREQEAELMRENAMRWFRNGGDSLEPEEDLSSPEMISQRYQGQGLHLVA